MDLLFCLLHSQEIFLMTLYGLFLRKILYFYLHFLLNILIIENHVKVKMTLTTPNCPVAESLPKEVEDSVKGINEVKDAKLELVWEPPWDKSMMSEAAKLELNL